MRLIDIAGPKQRRTCAFAIANNRGLSCGESCVLVSAKMWRFHPKLQVCIMVLDLDLGSRIFGNFYALKAVFLDPTSIARVRSGLKTRTPGVGDCSVCLAVPDLADRPR